MKRKKKINNILVHLFFKRACNYLGQSAVLDYPYKLPRTERRLYLVPFFRKNIHLQLYQIIYGYRNF